MKRVPAFLLFSLLSLVLGFVSGAIVWLILKAIGFGTELIWTFIPGLLGIHKLAYNLIVCVIGAVLIGLLANKVGPLPHLTEEVFATIKKDGGYPYNRLGVCTLAALLPLVFGGTLGPEAGLVGIIAGLCCWVGDNLKYRGERLQTLAETSLSVVLSIVFCTPLAGIIANLEPDDRSEQYGKKLVAKAPRIFIYAVGVAGGMLAMWLLGLALETLVPGISSGGLPHFTKDFVMNWQLLLWLVPLAAAGAAAGALYSAVNAGMSRFARLFKGSKVVPALVAGICLAVCGYFLPETMFSGEHQLGEVIAGWQAYDGWYLILSGALKLVLCCVCINLCWRGGAIFPIITGAAFIGFGIASLAGINGAFAAAVCVAGGHSYINRKPATTAALLLLCFPPACIPLILIVAFLTSKIPNPFLES